jgi:hypothetical protein
MALHRAADRRKLNGAECSPMANKATTASAAIVVSSDAIAAMQAARADAEAAVKIDWNAPQYVIDARAAVEAAQAAIAAVEPTLAILPEAAREAALTVLRASEAEAMGSLALAEAEHASRTERYAKLQAVNASAATLPESVREAALAAMIAAIESEYAPTPVQPSDVEAALQYGRRQASDRQHERNAAVAADSELVARGKSLLTAFEADSTALRCKAARKPNTRFPSLAALAPSGAGVANAADYDTAVRAVRAYMLASGWPRSESDGATTAESKWLAARGRFAAGMPKHGDRAAQSFGSGAEIAQYADGRFRLALPGTAGVRFLSRDNAAWQAFVGTAASAAPASTGAATAPVTATPTADASPYAGVAKTERCQHCGASNVVGHMAKCRACGSESWQAGA